MGNITGRFWDPAPDKIRSSPVYAGDNIRKTKQRACRLPLQITISKVPCQINIRLPPGKRELSSNEKLVPERKIFEPLLETESPKLYWQGAF